MTAANKIHDALRNLDSAFNASEDWQSALLGQQFDKLKEVVPRSAVSEIVSAMSQAIGQGNFVLARNWLLLGVLCHQDRMSDEIRRTGALRSSKYEFNGELIKRLVRDLLQNASTLLIEAHFERYLASIANLTIAAAAIRELDRSLRDFMGRRPLAVLKTLVVLVDSLFMLRHEGQWNLSSDNWRHYPAEDLAEAASYLIHRFDRIAGITDNEFVLIDEPGLLGGLYHKLLVKACKIRSFLEGEILVDAFSYSCTRQSKSLTINPPSPEFEKSIRLGYILSKQAELRRSIQLTIAIRNGEPSVEAIAEQFYKTFKNQVVAFLPLPVPRFVFLIPEHPLLTKFFGDDGLLAEEYSYLQDILESELATWEELSKFRIAEGMRIIDLIKLRRMFLFVARVTSLHLEAISSEDVALAYRSLVPVFAIETIERLLGLCIPIASIRAAMEMLSWGRGASTLVDLQYRPILQGERHYLTPMNLVGSMNWYRNLAYTQKRRVIDVAEEEAASRALLSTFGRTAGLVRKGFNTRIQGVEIELDIVFRFGDYLFIFECKHTLHPCNAFELRTTYEHMKKGAATLSRARTLFSDKILEAELYRRLGWNVLPATEVVTCIVSCNGMFPGLRIDDHPVRRWAELRNMVETGIVRIGSVKISEEGGKAELDTSGAIERNIWDGSTLTEEFLRKYLTEDYLHRDFFEAMTLWDRRFDLGKLTLGFSTFLLNSNSLKEATERL